MKAEETNQCPNCWGYQIYEEQELRDCKPENN